LIQPLQAVFKCPAMATLPREVERRCHHLANDSQTS